MTSKRSALLNILWMSALFKLDGGNFLLASKIGPLFIVSLSKREKRSKRIDAIALLSVREARN